MESCWMMLKDVDAMVCFGATHLKGRFLNL
jgi:hypothetical protein